ncbi:TPA: DUF3786 domain-containing protein [Candidatus Bipolaricaulota bacterium]|nr:DUF3786 domain-containing protein [Candidatus Bipolaricaulota bacterium]
MKEWRESLRPGIERAREELRGKDPVELAHRGGLDYRGGELQLRLFTKDYRISWPQLIVQELGSDEECEEELQALLLDYLRRADGTPPSGEWLAFRELPEGQFYYQAFQSYSGDNLVRAFGNDLEGFKRAAIALGGEPLEFGDAAFAFKVLPHIRMAVVYWQGDEEFPPKVSVLFDSSAGRYLPAEGLAILGRWLCAKLIELKGI